MDPERLAMLAIDKADELLRDVFRNGGATADAMTILALINAEIVRVVFVGASESDHCEAFDMLRRQGANSLPVLQEVARRAMQ